MYFRITKAFEVNIKILGEYEIQKGNYIYVGSALGPSPKALEFRITRHFKKEKPTQWHIDYLTNNKNSDPIGAICVDHSEKLECTFSKFLGSSALVSSVLPKFGSTDCKENCVSHLFKTDLSFDEIQQLITDMTTQKFTISIMTPTEIKVIDG